MDWNRHPGVPAPRGASDQAGTSVLTRLAWACAVAVAATVVVWTVLGRPLHAVYLVEAVCGFLGGAVTRRLLSRWIGR